MTNEDMQMLGKNTADLALTALGVWTKGAQAITAEVMDYSKKSAECSAAAWEGMIGAKNLEKAMEVQTEYLKSAYGDFVAKATKLGEIYAGLAKEAYKPFEGMHAKASSTK
jgi:phasin family protein